MRHGPRQAFVGVASFAVAASHTDTRTTIPEPGRTPSRQLSTRCNTIPARTDSNSPDSTLGCFECIQRLKRSSADVFSSCKSQTLPDAPVQCSEPTRDGIVEFRQPCYNIVFKREGGCDGKGRLLIALHGQLAPAKEDICNFLRDIDLLAASGKLCDLIAIIDVSRIVWPSLFKLPVLMAPLLTYKAPSSLFDRTCSYAIVTRRGCWFDSVVDKIITFQRGALPPIVTSSVHEADKLIAARFH